MYNRYIPQPDGTYQRSRMPEPANAHRPIYKRETPAQPKPVPELEACTPPSRPVSPCGHPRPSRPIPPLHSPPPRKEGGISGFLRQLLPKNIETEDLLIILLLLLMSGDCSEDQNTALLTLVIYLFL